MSQKILFYVTMWLLLMSFLNIVKEPNSLATLRKRYAKLRETFVELPQEHKFRKLGEPILLVGYHGMQGGLLGFNTNKGSEIGLCVDGCPNELMHVLLHELAHATVKEYDHSPAFWENLEELKKFAEEKKLYKTIDDPKGFCGAQIHD
jgi:hypothetical protein